MGRYNRWEYNGVTYRSQFEMRIAMTLDDHGIPFEYETEKYTYELPVRNHECKDCGGKVIHNVKTYVPDFIINGIIVEAKGRFTPDDRKKMLAILEQYPSADVRMLFYRDYNMMRKRKLYCSTWSQNNNMDYAVWYPEEDFPDDWLEDFRRGG